MRAMFYIVVITFVLAHVTAMVLQTRLENCVADRTALIEQVTN